MPVWVKIVLTVAVAFAGGTLFARLKVPAGAMVGAILFVGVANLATAQMYIPGAVKTISVAVAGLFIGMSITAETISNLRKVVKPTVILVVLIIAMCIVMGVVMYYATNLDVATSLFSVAPGGMVDMTIICLDMGGDGTVVAAIQVMRLLTVYFISMPLVKLITKKVGVKKDGENASQSAKTVVLEPESRNKRIIFSSFVALACAVVGKILGDLLNFSVMVLVISMLVSAVLNVKTGKLYLPKKVRFVAMVLCGAFIGMNMDKQSLLNLKEAMIPALIVCFGFVCINIVLALIMHKTCNMNIATAMLSTAAGGATEAALVAPDFGADPAPISVMQISRVIFTTLIYPIVVKVLFPLL